jgi:hypothetical protein
LRFSLLLIGRLISNGIAAHAASIAALHAAFTSLMSTSEMTYSLASHGS